MVPAFCVPATGSWLCGDRCRCGNGPSGTGRGQSTVTGGTMQRTRKNRYSMFRPERNSLNSRVALFNASAVEALTFSSSSSFSLALPRRVENVA